MKQMQKILVPVDFSECSRAAAEQAAWIAGETGAALTLLHVWQSAAFLAPDFRGAGAASGAGAFSDAVHENARRELARFSAALTARGVPVLSSLCEQGVPWRVIVETARRSSADLLVMGTHGLGGIEHALLGSVTEKVLRRAPCPVLSVRASMPGELPRAIRRLLVPIDYSEGSKLGLRTAMDLAALLGAEFDVVHVWDRPAWVSDTMTVQCDGKPRPLGELIRENEEKQAHDFLVSLAEVESVPKPRLLSGEPASAILSELEKGNYDCCVVATHGRSGLRHLLLGSVTEKIVRLAKVPVLTVPPARAASS